MLSYSHLSEQSALQLAQVSVSYEMSLKIRHGLHVSPVSLYAICAFNMHFIAYPLRPSQDS